jgi:transposase
MSEGTTEKSQAGVRLRKPERRQMAMVIQCPEDLVSSTHPVRLVMAVVAKLDLSRFHESIKAREGQAGRDATDPELLVALWLYACIRGIGSARELARCCEDSAAFRWLCGGVTVNHRLLSDFRTDHGTALDGPKRRAVRVMANAVSRSGSRGSALPMRRRG